jgi:hypothetical protein
MSGKTHGARVLHVNFSRPVTLDTPFAPTRGLYVGTGGDVAVTYANGMTDTLPGLAAGVWHPMHITQVSTTGTTAADIHVGY